MDSKSFEESDQRIRRAYRGAKLLELHEQARHLRDHTILLLVACFVITFGILINDYSWAHMRWTSPFLLIVCAFYSGYEWMQRRVILERIKTEFSDHEREWTEVHHGE